MPAMRFYLPGLHGGRVELDEDESRHARKVMRVEVGDQVELFDGMGGVAGGKVIETGRRVGIEVGVVERAERQTPWVEVATAMPKGDRAAMLVEKVSELGADRVVVLQTERSVVEPGGGKMERWRRVAVESAKQSGRAWVMEVGGVVGFDDYVREVGEGTRLITDTIIADRGLPNAECPSPDLCSGARDQRSERVTVLVGPEGGWTDAERITARGAGFVPWRLGPHVLRVETAAIAAVAIVRGRT